MPTAIAAVVRLMGTDLLTVRVDLDCERRDQLSSRQARGGSVAPREEGGFLATEGGRGRLA
jgi:hypothetical protein